MAILRAADDLFGTILDEFKGGKELAVHTLSTVPRILGRLLPYLTPLNGQTRQANAGFLGSKTCSLEVSPYFLGRTAHWIHVQFFYCNLMVLQSLT